MLNDSDIVIVYFLNLRFDLIEKTIFAGIVDPCQQFVEESTKVNF